MEAFYVYIGLAALFMGVVLWATQLLIGPFLARAGWRYLALTGLIAMGILSYGWFGQILGAFRMRDFVNAFRRGRG